MRRVLLVRAPIVELKPAKIAMVKLSAEEPRQQAAESMTHAIDVISFAQRTESSAPAFWTTGGPLHNSLELRISRSIVLPR